MKSIFKICALATLTILLAFPSHAQQVIVYGSQWLGGYGVDVHWNAGDCCCGWGSSYTVCPSSGGSVYTGCKWQCVELAQRLYTTRNWYCGGMRDGNCNFVAYASQIYDGASCMGMSRYANGSGYVPVPGDMVIWAGNPGHVAVVDWVDSGHVYMCEQNFNSSGRSTCNRSGSNGSFLTRSDGWGTIRGVVHSPNNTFGGPPPRPAGRNDVYVQATDNSIWGKSWVSGQGWYAWQQVGGGTYYGPSATSWGINDINVFVKGVDNQIWVDTWVGSWGGFYSIGGNPVGSPASCSQGVGNLEVFWRGTDNALWHKSYNNGWGVAESLGGNLNSDPCAVSWGAGRIDVFVRGSDNACWQLTWTSSVGWQGWWSLGGYLSGKVAAASWGSGRLDLFCRSSDNQLYHKGWQGSWYPSNTGWEALGGNCTTDPGACSYASGQIDVYVRGTDYGLWHKWFDSQTWTWSGFESLGGDFHNSPAVCSFNHAQ